MFFMQQGVLSGSLLRQTCESGGNRIALITDSFVETLYGKELLAQLSDWGLAAELFSFPSGEAYKTRETKQQLEDRLLGRGFGRDSVIIALGGGVVTDLAGFLASTYCRGVPFISIPTTLMAMVDAAIGGKCAVNTSLGKNMIGAFYQPEAIFIDPDLLKTLPKEEMNNGIVEMVKHGLIADARHFDALPQFSPELISESAQIKCRIVEEDPKEAGKRRLLNFGHTVGHAIESVSQYQIPHGAAVAAGMLAESYLSHALGYLPMKSLERIISHLIPFAQTVDEDLIDFMKRDKKALKGRARFVLLQEIGLPLDFGGTYCDYVEDRVLKSSLEWTNELLRSHHRTDLA